MIKFVPWSDVGTIEVSPGDNVVDVGAFELAEGADTLWVRMTNTGEPGPWPWSYGILSFRTSEGQPLGSIKAYNSFDGEVFRLGVGLTPPVRTGVLTFEPRGYNLAWIRRGNPWSLRFQAQSGSSGGGNVSNLWNRDSVNSLLLPATAGDGVALGAGNLSASAGTFVGNVYIHKTSADPVGVHGIRFIDGAFNSLYTNDIASGGGTQIAYQHNLNGSATYQILGNGEVRIGGNPNSSPLIRLNSDGSANFVGRVTASNITFRSVDPSFSVEGGYVGPELDLLEEIVRLEALVKELYEKLRMAPENGWPVWDGNEDLINSNIAKSRHI